MKLFTNSKGERLTARQEALASRIAGRITRIQRRAAEWLNGKTTGWPAKTWLLLLVLFCFAFGAYCLYLLVIAFN